MSDIISDRFTRARELMIGMGIDVLALTPSSDMLYMTGYRGKQMERPIIFFLSEDSAVLLTPAFELGNIPESTRGHVICIPWEETENPYNLAFKSVKPEGKVIAIGEWAPSFVFHNMAQQFSALEWKLADGLMKALRSVKSVEEIEFLRTSNILAGNALRHLISEGIKGMTELEVAVKLRKYCTEEGLLCYGNPIVAAGTNSALPHHEAGDHVIESGDVVVMDFGGDYMGYQSDMTRTFVVDYAPEDFDKIYSIVLNANRTALKEIEIGKTYESIDEASRSVIRNAGYGEYFTHRNGHGIGMDGHEHPYIVGGNTALIEKGNVFSDEPGIYIQGRFGVRIEDIVAVTENGADVLTDWPRDILVIS